MNKTELIKLFETYLFRLPTESEITTHGRKSYESFKNEIKNCKERQALLDPAEKIQNPFKIGIILTGHVRTLPIVDSIKRYLAGYDYDVFVHAWDNVGRKGRETDIEDVVDPEYVLSRLKEVPNLRKSVVENNKKFLESLSETVTYFNYSSPEPFIKSQLYSINRGFKLLEEYSLEHSVTYNLVLRLRFDTELFQFRPTRSLVEDIENYPIIFMPNSDNLHAHPDYGTACWACNNMYYGYDLKHVHVFEHTNIVCDLYAYGSFKSMKTYCNLYHNYDNILKSYEDTNLEMYSKVNSSVQQVGNVYQLRGSNDHVHSVYYYYCSYPERVLQLYLKNFMLVESKQVKLKLVR
jgi:hypothetical protein